MQAIGLISALAIIVEALMENFLQSVPTTYKTWAAAAVGVVLCIAYGADILALMGYVSSVAYIGGYIGQVLTGLLIGRGSNYINDLVSRVRTPKMTELRAESIEMITSQGGLDNSSKP